MQRSEYQSPKARILMVDDTPTSVEPYVRYLRENGFTVIEATDEKSAREAIASGLVDLAILDVDLMKAEQIEAIKIAQRQAGLPVFVPEERAGHRIANWSLSNFPDVGILMTSNQKTEVSDMILGLDAGGDDYFVKGAVNDYVLASVRSVLRRRRFEQGRRTQFGGFVLDRRLREVEFSGTPIPLTSAEYRLLEALCDEPNVTKTRQELYQAAFSRLFEDRNEADARAIDTLVKNIRRKAAGVATEVIPIATIYGVGYRLER